MPHNVTHYTTVLLILCCGFYLYVVVCFPFFSVWLDGGQSDTDHVDAQVECDLLNLLSSSSEEFSVKDGSNDNKGRLKSSLHFWVEILDPLDFLVDMIRCGYMLLFAKYPSQCFLKNNRSALQHLEFVVEAIRELLSNSCIVEHDVPPFSAWILNSRGGKEVASCYWSSASQQLYLFHCHSEFRRRKCPNLRACWILLFRRGTLHSVI